MMKFSTISILLYHTVAAASLQRQTTSGCCFQLSSVGELNSIVEEDGAGNLLAGGEFQDAGFCLEGTAALTDSLGGTCFFQASNQQFGCFKGRGPLVPFEIAPGVNERSYLTYSNGTKLFHACPAGTANEQYYYIYSDSKPDKTGCFEVNLQLKNRTAGCHVWNPTVTSTASTITLQLMTMTSTPVKTWETRTRPTNSLATQIGIARAVTTSTPGTSSPSQTCKIAPSAPSLPPIRVGYPDAEAPDGLRDSAAEVSISGDNSTIFQYSIPAPFVPANASSSGGGGGGGAYRRLCALQFRMPFCSNLPGGYPCYHFSGLEQEMLADSGMNFALIATDDDDDDGAATVAWDDKKLHKVKPGEDSILGTFECGVPPSPSGTYNVAAVDRRIAWRATSVRDFSLEFLQAGIGDRPRFQDGIGIWVVPCL